MKLKKQIVLIIAMFLLPLAASADKSGSCGDNVTYTYVEATNTLTISGTGDMNGYNWSGAPWGSYGSSIKTVVIEDGVTSIGKLSLAFCSSLTSVTIGNSVTSIGESAFGYCSGLTSVTIGNSVTSIGDNAFNGCWGITSVEVVVSDLSIFCNNQVKGLINTNIGKTITLVDNVGKEIKEYVIPDGVASIGEGAFNKCSGLTSVTIPNFVTSIGNYTFYGCTGLTSVTIPNSVTSIEASAFLVCI